MSTVVLYCWCHSDSTSVLLYFTFVDWNLTKLVTNQVLIVRFQVRVLRPMEKLRWLPWRLVGYIIFDFSAATERNSMKLYMKQLLRVLYQGFVFRVDRVTKMTDFSSDWLKKITI